MSGQKQDDKGFEYRGKGVAPELMQLGTLLKRYVPSTGPLIVWDVHTAVGKPGTGDMLICDTDKQRELLLAALPRGGDSARRIRQGGKGVYGVRGSAMGGIYRLIKGIPDYEEPTSPDVVVTQEFATVPEKKTLWALVNKHAGDNTVDLKPYFYIDDKAWLSKVRMRGLLLYRDFLQYWPRAARAPKKALLF